VDALASLAMAGFDIAHRFDVRAAARLPGLSLLAGDARLGILLGNTRALWPPFQAALADPTLAAERDPLDRYTERSIDAAFAPAAPRGIAPRVLYAHRRYDGAFLPLQRLAAVTGLGALSPSNLVIHPTYGPWFALRAVVVLEGEPPVCAPIAQPCGCDASCRDRFEHAQGSGDPRDWLAVRDACSLRAWRYGDDQIRHHYGALTHMKA